ncbi:hypothetical protein ACFL0M_03540 [Thermodesulfobacteriota bacterium]
MLKGEVSNTLMKYNPDVQHREIWNDGKTMPMDKEVDVFAIPAFEA